MTGEDRISSGVTAAPDAAGAPPAPRLLYSATMSLDGFIAGPPGGDQSWMTDYLGPNPLLAAAMSWERSAPPTRLVDAREPGKATLEFYSPGEPVEIASVTGGSGAPSALPSVAQAPAAVVNLVNPEKLLLFGPMEPTNTEAYA